MSGPVVLSIDDALALARSAAEAASVWSVLADEVIRLREVETEFESLKSDYGDLSDAHDALQSELDERRSLLPVNEQWDGT